MDNKINQNGNSNSNGSSSSNGNSTIEEKAAIEDDFSVEEVAPKAEDKNTFEIIQIGSEFYKRVGFYCAFNEDPEEEFRQELNNLKLSIQNKTNNLEEEYKNDITRFEARKKEAEDKKDAIKKSLDDYEKEVTVLETELPGLRELFKKAQENIKATVISIGTKKETLIKDRQEALTEELNRLNEELETVVKKRMGINEEIFLKQKDVLEKKKQFWQKMFEKYEKEHLEILDKLKLFGLSGFHFMSSSFLYNAGFIAATAAGAFFAFFAETNYFASGGVPSFIIQSLFLFSTQFMGQNLDAYLLEPITRKVVYAGILLLIFLGLFGLVFLVSWFCQYMYQKLFEKSVDEKGKNTAIKNGNGENEDSYAIEINLEKEDLPIKTKISEKSFLGFWVKAIPSLLFLAIIFLLVSLGTDVTNLKSLDAAIAGYAIGFMIASASAGILYIYLTMIIERRLERQRNRIDESEEAKISWSWMNFELVLFISAFISAVLVILIFFQHPFRTIYQTQSLASLMMFVVCSLLAAFTLGFGIRFQSLEVSRDLLETTCDIIQTKIIRISRPLQIYLTQKENAQFNFRFIEIRDEIMNLMLSRTRLTRRAISAPLIKENDSTEKTKFFSNLNKWVKDKLSWNDKNKNKNEEVSDTNEPEKQSVIFTASEEIKVCFPMLDAELGALEAEAKELQDKISSTGKEIIYRKEQKGGFYEKKLKELEVQELRFRNYHKAITNREKDFHRKETSQRQKEKYFTQKIIEGFELGNWFSKHNPTGTTIPETLITEIIGGK